MGSLLRDLPSKVRMFVIQAVHRENRDENDTDSLRPFLLRLNNIGDDDG
jgi:hypothetical protein